MSGGRLRVEPERLVDGLTVYERTARLEKTLYGHGMQREPALERQVEELRRRVEDLESFARRQSMPFWLRWIAGFKKGV